MQLQTTTRQAVLCCSSQPSAAATRQQQLQLLQQFQNWQEEIDAAKCANMHTTIPVPPSVYTAMHKMLILHSRAYKPRK